ncbi:GNAT family N-acetyltransferase [Candidatus Tisiphia endosymbiont of Hybos culiciformis]|uniref:GNAT family N-acetyltransferase n=1 Tax=Candidatus Tisiphia endosymbiont of Hybos culiciformis TaxID=3139331 RepID=UPI003CCAE21F
MSTLKHRELNDAKISFCLAQPQDEDLIKSWFDKPHVKNHWDNSSDLLENLRNYLQGTKDIFDYWLGFYDMQPYALIMTSDANDSTPEHLVPWVKPEETNWTIDFMIGQEDFLGLGLSSMTLARFINEKEQVTTWLIDPNQSNYKAISAYKTAGFQIVDSFVPSTGYFKDVPHYLMILNNYS